MENPSESNSSLTKPNRDNILAQGQYSVQLMQLYDTPTKLVSFKFAGF